MILSRSYCCTQHDRPLAWYCRLSVCLSVCLWWTVWSLNDTSYSKSVWTTEQEVPPSAEHDFTTFHPLHRPYSINFSTYWTIDLGRAYHLAIRLHYKHTLIKQTFLENSSSGIAVVSTQQGYSRQRSTIGLFLATADFLVIFVFERLHPD